jgi:hypothetical protein
VYVCCRPDLAKPASTLYTHNLSGVLEAAIRATNAQFEDPDIIKRLDCRLLEVFEFFFVDLKIVIMFIITYSVHYFKSSCFDKQTNEIGIIISYIIPSF